jgi:hypothetical protein
MDCVTQCTRSRMLLVMPPTRAHPQRTLKQRAWLFVCAIALACSPLVVNIWPALGKGRMLFVGAPAAEHVEHAAHDGHASHDEHEASGSQPHHDRHCALCVLALLGWAPPAVASIGCVATHATHGTAWIAISAPRLQPLWRSAHARDPPLS